MAGVLLYGGIGWGLDHWLGTRWLVAVGVIAGAALGTYQTWARFRLPEETPTQQDPGSTAPEQSTTGDAQASSPHPTDDQTQ
ncbi:AtpZ/AtpI family protein [Nocardioides sp. GY 10127]|uniref:AtpZ/AtpI family protein n=1 Tax=Nocardioides sp. GY 10127 TaxID=2569762 RepID=UPI001F10D7A8|nr:AtpZ/AtpI family protein [Nocardioides sp. GY 10127]